MIPIKITNELYRTKSLNKEERAVVYMLILQHLIYFDNVQYPDLKIKNYFFDFTEIVYSHTGLCVLLLHYTSRLYNYEVYKNTQFIEFEAQRPDFINGDSFWWPLHNTESRFKAIIEAIKLTFK